MKKGIALSIAVGCTLAASVLRAQTWPQRPVKVIVPYTAGGTTDTQARIISERLSVALGQQFIVENRVGAGGAIAAEFVAKSTADGYTLFFSGTTQLSTLPLVQKVNYDPLKDFAPISILGTNPLVLGVHISVPAKTLKEFIERLNKMGIDALGNSPAEFAELIRADSSLWRDAVNAAGIKQE